MKIRLSFVVYLPFFFLCTGLHAQHTHSGAPDDVIDVRKDGAHGGTRKLYIHSTDEGYSESYEDLLALEDTYEDLAWEEGMSDSYEDLAWEEGMSDSYEDPLEEGMSDSYEDPLEEGRNHDHPYQLRGGKISEGDLRAAHGFGHATTGRTSGHAKNKESEEQEYEEQSTPPQYDVLIVGAGAAGLSAAHILHEEEWTYKVLEAHKTEIGGRTRQSFEFGLNIDLGAEYIHTTADIGKGTYDSGFDLLQEMVEHTLDETKYKTEYTKQEPPKVTLLPSNRREIYSDPPEYRWAGGMSWYSFLTEEVAYKEIQENIVKDCVVTKISTNEEDGVKVQCEDDRDFTAFHVIVTVPMKMLQTQSITFSPQLPRKYTTAIDEFNVAGGFKIWLEFSNRWYHEYFTRDKDYQSYNNFPVSSYEGGNEAGYRLFWNEMYPYNTNRHVMGGFIYGDKAKEYEGKTDEEIKDSILELLEDYYKKKAKFTGKWKVQNWSNEPYIQSAYTIFADSDYQQILHQPLPSKTDPKLLFAGEALPVGVDSWGYLHGAAQSGREKAKELIRHDMEERR